MDEGRDFAVDGGKHLGGISFVAVNELGNEVCHSKTKKNEEGVRVYARKRGEERRGVEE